MPLFRLLVPPPIEARFPTAYFVITVDFVPGANHHELRALVNGSPCRYWWLTSLGLSDESVSATLYADGFDIPPCTVPGTIFRKLVAEGKAE